MAHLHHSQAAVLASELIRHVKEVASPDYGARAIREFIATAQPALPDPGPAQFTIVQGIARGRRRSNLVIHAG